MFYRQRDTRALRKSVSMDQSCELPADVPDDAMEAETKADNKEEGMVSGGPDIGCLASVLVFMQAFPGHCPLYSTRLLSVQEDDDNEL